MLTEAQMDEVIRMNEELQGIKRRIDKMDADIKALLERDDITYKEKMDKAKPLAAQAESLVNEYNRKLAVAKYKAHGYEQAATCRPGTFRPRGAKR